MGCTSSSASLSLRVVPLPPQATNSYIDKFTGLVLTKLKQKFYLHADKQSKDLMIFNFMKLYSTNKLNTEALTKIMLFFYDRQSQNIPFRHFITKYAILIKCEPHVFYRILFQVYKNNNEVDYMTEQQFSFLHQTEAKYFSRPPKAQAFPLFLEQFNNIMAQAGFKVQEYQFKLNLIREEEIPLKAINRQILDCDFNNFTTGDQYYLLSQAWFKRWCFYYRDADHNQYKSTKIIKEDSSNSRKYKEREVSMQDRRSKARSSSQVEGVLFEQPAIISFEDVEGQYRGQFKEDQSIQLRTKVITGNLWKMLCTLHQAEQIFKRLAMSPSKLQYYPKSIYYLQAGDLGQFIVESQQIMQLSVSFRIAELKSNKLSSKIVLFTKNFGQKNWRQIQDTKNIGQISLDRRFFIVVALNRERFIQKNYRKEIKNGNYQPGDIVYTDFAFTKTTSQAYIIKICRNNSFKVHFKGFSFRYQMEVSRSELYLTQSDAVVSSSKKSQTIIKGIANVGNTCFINSVIQCLVYTPILDQFLVNFPFEQKSHPIGYALSLVAKALINNQIPQPQHFKDTVDKYMPIFSGNDQQDAQQFLNLMLDKINDQLKDKPTVIDYLFRGKIQSKLTCNTCKNIKYIEQKMYILSLPIPQSDYNYYSIILVPVTSKSMKKIVFKLHKNSSVAEYCNNFEQKIGYSKKDFIFVETNFGFCINKVKQQINNPASQDKKVVDVGIVPNVSLLAFQKLPSKYYYSILTNKPESAFRDYRLHSQTSWTICKITSQNPKNHSLQYLANNNDIIKINVEKDLINQLPKLGSKSDLIPRKIVLRKHNTSQRKLQSFGLEMIFSIPKWASYEDIINLVQRYSENIREKGSRMDKTGGKEKKDYIIRLFMPNKLKCIFCLKEAPFLNIEPKDIKYCCQVLEKDVPLAWASKNKAYDIFIDWIDFTKCNSSFCTYIEIDHISQSVENARKEEFVTLENCLKLQSQPEIVEMQCQKCKEKYQSLQNLIRTMPNILVLHMKQFRYTPQGHLIKLDLRLKWQELLDSSKYSLTSNGKLYELFAVVKHSGNSYSGHYTCIAKRKHPFENKKVWVNFDDESTDFVKQQAFIEDAYLLLYKKVDMPTSSLVIYQDFKKI